MGIGKNGKRFQMNELTELRSLTIWPEWVYAILHLGKNVENRVWKAGRTLLGNRIAIHSGVHFGGIKTKNCIQNFWPVIEIARSMGYSYEDIYSEVGGKHWVGFDVFSPEGKKMFPMDSRIIMRGAIVATAVVQSCSFLYSGDKRYADGMPKTAWSEEGKYGWRLSDIDILKEPIPAKGKQRVWKVSPEDMEKILEQRDDA